MSDETDADAARSVRAMNRGLADAHQAITRETVGPGWYKGRLVKGGPYVPVLVYMPCPMDPWGWPLDRSRFMRCQVLGVDVAPNDPWPAHVEISPAEYAWLLKAAAWDAANDPAAPLANPKRPAPPLSSQPPLF